MRRSIQDFIQLITQDNGCGLITRHFLQKGSKSLFEVSEYTKNPIKEIFINRTDEIKNILTGIRYIK